MAIVCLVNSWEEMTIVNIRSDGTSHAVTVVTVVVPGEIIVIITSGVAVELARPGAGGEAAALSFVSVVTVVVVREELGAGHRPAQRLALPPCHDGAELCLQSVAPVTELINVEIFAVSSIGSRGGRSRGRSRGSRRGCCFCCGRLCCSLCGGFLSGGVWTWWPRTSLYIRVLRTAGATSTKFRVSAFSEEVALAGEMGEPGAVCTGPALVLALPCTVGVSVVAHDVGLGQITGSFLEVSAAPGHAQDRNS